MDLSELLAPHPPVLRVDPDDVAAGVARSGRVLVVLDDDPTGTQSVADLPVLTRWEQDDLAWALGLGSPAVYVLTNTRGLGPEDAARINREVVGAALSAAQRVGVEVGFVSRGDSTLRGHFPLETDVITDALVAAGAGASGGAPDAVLVVPAFPDAGRVTVDGVHRCRVGEELLPVAETEFARDATFGYTSSDLAAYVAEKSGGRVAAADVVRLTLDVVRRGPQAVAGVLRTARGGAFVVVDAVEEDDLRVLALGLEVVEGEGMRVLHRVGPPFVRARIGQVPRAPLTPAEVFRDPGAEDAGSPGTGVRAAGGLVVVGSHVGLTTRQLAELARTRDLSAHLELDVDRVVDPARRAAHLEALAGDLASALAGGDVVLSTSRSLRTAEDGAASLAISVAVSAAVVEVVQRVLALVPPRFVVAKGGITSSDVARYGLGIRRALVRGPLLPGLVSLWEPVGGPAAGIPYVVFAGNVGDDGSLAAVVATLSASPAPVPA